LFNDDLAVLADPGQCVRTYGTREDFLIASACLNSTVSGLVSRTVLNEKYIGPQDFHGAKFYTDLSIHDRSNTLLDTVSRHFPDVQSSVAREVSTIMTSDRHRTWAGWAAVENIQQQYGIESVNFIKPGVGETTRVLLRRVPWRILVRDFDDPHHAHIRLLAKARAVPIEQVADLPYSCIGLIKAVQ
ncbi:MAG: cysteine protease StiP domain-containing protein, partial [Mycobacteriaceae bacterium]